MKNRIRSIASVTFLLFFTEAFAEELFKATPLTKPGEFTKGIEGPACDKAGNVFAVNFKEQGTIGRVSPDGKGKVFITLPEGSTGNGIRFDKNGNMFIADYPKHNVLRVDAKTKKLTVLAHEPRMNQPNDLAIDAKGNLYVLERNGNALRIVRPNGSIFTLAGTGKKGTQDGPAKQATFSGPKHLCLDGQGNVIIADDNNHLIRLYDPKTKSVSTILGGDAEPKSKLNRPHGVSIAPDGALWVSDSWNNRVVILRNYQQ